MRIGIKVRRIKRRRRSRNSHPQMEFGSPDDFPVSAGPDDDPDEYPEIYMAGASENESNS